MVRTIYVVFVENKVYNTSHLKQYMFLCSNDNVKVGDIIKDPRYSPFMQVVKTTLCSARVQGGFTLKDIQIETLNGRYIQGSDFDINKQRNMETRNISITLEQAMKWYNSGNITLRTLALNAYTSDELELNYDLIASRVDQASGQCITPMCEYKKFQVLAKLAIIAKYYNKNWKKTTYNTGYFIGNYKSGNGPVVEILNDVGVYQHTTVQYAGVVYFKSSEDAVKAVKILGDEVKELFK